MSSEHNVIQRSPEWHELRLGKITASRFGDVMTQARSGSGLSKTAETYMLDLLSEFATGESQGPPTTPSMQWGIDCEPAAREVYSQLTGLEVQEVGFVQHPDQPMIGGSPDGLIGEEGGLEIKCPGNTRNHLGYMLGDELPKEHIPQVQGLMWITGRKWWDFVSYDPRIRGLDLAMWIHRVDRDEAYIETLAERVFDFWDVLLQTLIALKIGGD